MKSKKVILNSILVSFIMLFSFASIAQSDQETLKELDKLAQSMFETLNNRDYEGILEMTHPKVFELAPKESIKAVFKSMFEGNEEFSIDIPKTIPEYKLSKVFKNEIDSLQYVFISYNMKMNMTFHQQEFDDETKTMMKTMMGAKGMDVTFVSNNTLDIFMKNRITIIVKDNDTNGKWVMVNYDPDSPLFYNIVPASLMESAKAYNQDLMLESKKKEEK